MISKNIAIFERDGDVVAVISTKEGRAEHFEFQGVDFLAKVARKLAVKDRVLAVGIFHHVFHYRATIERMVDGKVEAITKKVDHAIVSQIESEIRRNGTRKPGAKENGGQP